MCLKKKKTAQREFIDMLVPSTAREKIKWIGAKTANKVGLISVRQVPGRKFFVGIKSSIAQLRSSESSKKQGQKSACLLETNLSKLLVFSNNPMAALDRAIT